MSPFARPVDPWIEWSRRIRSGWSGVGTSVEGLWVHDIESLEAVAQDEDTKLLCLRMAAMSKAGTLEPFIDHLRRDDGVDDDTKGRVAEIASDAQFLLAVEDYVRRTTQIH